ncbi:pirin family protein [Craterilacuibacter sp.]|uniref:pirin family protein n=1 Tax=Craterilacuibacter sp. TaxID=2870909 RepID=UPI003F393AB1
MLELRPASQRGQSALNWLQSRHTFSFGHYHDPAHSGFSDLLVINDATVAPGQGFGTHPHRNMEIFSYSDKRGKLRLIIAPEEASDALPVYQDIRVYAGLFDGNECASLSIGGRYAYIHMAKGSAEINGQRLYAGDGARVRDENTLTLSHGRQAEVLVFDLRPNE